MTTTITSVSTTKYSGLITSEHNQKPNFMAWLNIALQMIVDDQNMLAGMPSAFDIDSAVGVQLDQIGKYVGRPRTLNYNPTSATSPVLDDTHYVTALKAKIAWNNWDGSIQQMFSIWNSLFPNNSLSIIDNQNMTMSAVINGSLDAQTNEMVANKIIIPKPSGVGLTIISNTVINATPYMGGVVANNDTISLTVPHG